MKMKRITKLLLLLLALALAFSLTACKKDNTPDTPDTPTVTPDCTDGHTYRNACDTDCEICGEVREVGSHVYDNGCDRVCNECGSMRTISHTYDNNCDTECNECKATRVVGEHTYDNGCDPSCNECGATRETEHAYDNGCDRVCNNCGEDREVGEHVYTDECDTECNECGSARKDPPHLDAALDGTCDLCGAVLFISTPADKFDLPELPLYDGTNSYLHLNGGKPFFLPSQITDESYEFYSELDALGRCGVAVGCLGPDTLPTGDRNFSLSGVSPSGWQGSSIYERSHLIAWSLGAETTNKKNLITGTFTLNGVMQEFEAMVCDYIKETGNHVMYRATPVFEGDNLLATGLILEAYSVEDGGEGIEFCIYIHNVQKDYEIDYATGKATLDSSSDAGRATFVFNKSKKKIHVASCTSVASMNESNALYWYEGYAEFVDYLLANGYITSATQSGLNCGSCKPQNVKRQVVYTLPPRLLAPAVFISDKRAA